MKSRMALAVPAMASLAFLRRSPGSIANVSKWLARTEVITPITRSPLTESIASPSVPAPPGVEFAQFLTGCLSASCVM